jgi:hypothetical protein
MFAARHGAMKIAKAALVIASISGMPACTAIGVTIGGNISKMDTIPPPTMRGAQAGEEIEVAFTDATGPHVLAGDYAGSEGDTLLIASDAGTTRVPFDRIWQIRIKKGSYWVEGMIAGLVVDAALVTAVAVKVNSMKIDLTNGQHW